MFVEPDGASTIAVLPGANGLLNPEDLPELNRDDVVLAQFEIPFATVGAALVAARGAGARSVLSLSPVVPGMKEFVAMADLVVCNRGEAVAALETATSSTAKTLAAGLLSLGAKAVVVTLGAEGAVLADVTGVSDYPAVAARTMPRHHRRR